MVPIQLELTSHAALDFANKLRKHTYNNYLLARDFAVDKLITTCTKTIAMVLPLSSTLRSHRDIGKVILGVKHSYVLKDFHPITIFREVSLPLEVKSTSHI